MRLIDADALLDKMQDYGEGQERLMLIDPYWVRKAPTIERPQWIPCSERLPEESLDSVIGWDRFRERCVFVQYMDGHFQITGKQESFDIIAWMPIPKPYEEEGGAE